MAALNYTMVPSSLVHLIALLAHKMTPSYFLNQSMPRMMSMPLKSKTMRFTRKSTPLYGNTNCWTYMFYPHFTFRRANKHGMLHNYYGQMMLVTNDDDIKECDAPKSNQTVAECELAKNIPNTTS
jgi:hypothetical protein